MKRMILSLALAAGAITQVNAQTLPDVGGLPGAGSGADPGLLLDLLNGGFDQFAGEDGMLPAGEGVGQLIGLGEQVRTLLVDPLNSALPDPLLLPLLSDLSIALSDLNTGGTPSLPGLPGLPGDGEEGDLPDFPGADDLSGVLEGLIGEAGGAEQLTMLLDSLTGGDLGDPAMLADLLDPSGLQGMFEDLIGEAGGAEQLTMVLDGLAEVAPQ